MVDFERFAQLLDEIAINLPKEIYIELNGGVNLLEEHKVHPESKSGELYILGNYNRNHLGRYINIYYGSFMQTYGHYNEEELAAKIANTLKHEFTHHLESLAGEKDLEIADAEFIDKYKENFSQ